jgi:hypothetical protein
MWAALRAFATRQSNLFALYCFTLINYIAAFSVRDLHTASVNDCRGSAVKEARLSLICRSDHVAMFTAVYDGFACISQRVGRNVALIHCQGRRDCLLDETGLATSCGPVPRRTIYSHSAANGDVLLPDLVHDKQVIYVPISRSLDDEQRAAGENRWMSRLQCLITECSEHSSQHLQKH